MSRSPVIEILPDHVANQIAAGEVVERPASVVKELVENALDAGATRVEIRIRGGGKSEIVVTDDGHGMPRADALLALDRHATSKIRVAEDLQSIRSFGFRGEAIPSIAAVSRFELHTAAEPGDGVRVRVDHGRVQSAVEVPRQVGTTVGVRSLFHSVPARAEFLKSAAAEARAVSGVVTTLALANPRVGFRLESAGRALLDLAPAADFGERVAQLWGDLSRTLLPIREDGDRVRVAGLVQRPDAAARAGARRFAFVNGRPFEDRDLMRLVDEAYRTTVVEGLRPSAFLLFSVAPDRVDVNVHPAKTLVRFRDREAVESALITAVREALGRLESTRPVGRVAPRPARVSPAGEPSPNAGTPMPQLALFVGARRADEGAAEAKDADRAGTDPSAALPSSDLWQLHDRYILASTRDGLMVIDQHSAHERVLYEEIMDAFDTGAASQRLLFPVTLRLSPEEAGALEELGGLLARVGFEIDPFGPGTFVLHAVPTPHPRFDGERCLREMLRELTEGSALVDSARNQHERVAKTMACKGAIKAGQRLGPAEVRELFDRLFATRLPGHDVHGRPTIVRLTIDELDRRFGRT